MIKKIVGLLTMVALCHESFPQVDTTFIYRTGTPFGTLDLRIAKSATRYYYLQEGKTFSYRESSPGVKTNAYRDMTSWDSSPYTQGNLREKNGNTDAFVMNYRLLFPAGYNANYKEGYPLILMVHGLGERGNCWDNDCYWTDRAWKPNTNNPPAPADRNHPLLNNDHNLLHGGLIHLEMRNAAGNKLPNDPALPARSFPGFVLFPQNLNGWNSGESQDVIKIVRLLMKKYNIDPNRIYIHGLSNGGAYVYDMIKRAPWLFSAAAPMSAVNDGFITSQEVTSTVASIPLWIFQGGQDTNPTPGKTEGYIKKFKEAGLSVRYTKYNNLGHGTWNNAYGEADFFTWLRSKDKSQIHVFADNPTLCTTTGEGVKMDLAEGFLAYQWERDGVIIPGATTASYTATATGTYRARFSRKSETPTEAEWNRWSDPVTVVTSSPAQAEVAQTGTVLLRDLNNYNYAHLSSVQKADHYYWYKDGVLIDLPGNMDDTSRHVKLSSGSCTTVSCAGNGVYTLVTAGFNNCPSPPSEAKYIFFSNQAPVNITAPSSFGGTATSESTATLSWTDASSDENNFELWRRKQTGVNSYSPWVMAALTTADVTAYNDSGLEPSSTYQYKMRAINNTGRSNYTPAANNQFLTIVTSSDTEPPSPPANLTATATAISEITLTWQPSADNTGIREYVIYYDTNSVNTGTAVTAYTLRDLPINTNFTFTVKAKDLDNNLSVSSNGASAHTYVTGLYYEHATGAFTDIDLVDWSLAEFKGKVSNFTLGPRTQEDYFNFEYEGYLYITKRGTYQFQTASDDGSRLTLNNSIIVDNDGMHGTQTATSAAISLSSGPQLINVKYFENTGDQNLVVRYKGPDTRNRWVAIPDAALRSGTPASTRQVDPAPPVYKTQQLVLALYPNPLKSSQELSVKATTESDAPVQIKIADFFGHVHYDNTLVVEELADGVQVYLQKRLRKGIYIVTALQEKQIVRKILIVNN